MLFYLVSSLTATLANNRNGAEVTFIGGLLEVTCSSNRCWIYNSCMATILKKHHGNRDLDTEAGIFQDFIVCLQRSARRFVFALNFRLPFPGLGRTVPYVL